jgi:hypothetical protein
MNFPNRGFYRGDLNAALKDYGVLLVPKEEVLAVDNDPGPDVLLTVNSPTFADLEPVDIGQTLIYEPILQAKSQGFTGNECQKCGSMRVVMTGHCETCQDCGETSSCG